MVVNHFHIVPCKKPECVDDGYAEMYSSRQVNWCDLATGQMQTALAPTVEVAAWVTVERYVARLYGDWHAVQDVRRGSDAGS